MAGSVTQSVSKSRFEGTNVWVVSLDWVGDSGTGAVSDAALSALVMDKIAGGYLFRVKTVPGTAAPTAYGITLKDADGLDILGGVGAARSTSAAEVAVPKQDSAQAIYGPVYVEGQLTFGLSGNTNGSATGTVRFYFA